MLGLVTNTPRLTCVPRRRDPRKGHLFNTDLLVVGRVGVFKCAFTEGPKKIPRLHAQSSCRYVYFVVPVPHLFLGLVGREPKGTSTIFRIPLKRRTSIRIAQEPNEATGAEEQEAEAKEDFGPLAEMNI